VLPYSGDASYFQVRSLPSDKIADLFIPRLQPLIELHSKVIKPIQRRTGIRQPSHKHSRAPHAIHSLNNSGLICHSPERAPSLR
jgi:hypothetical protein